MEVVKDLTETITLKIIYLYTIKRIAAVVVITAITTMAATTIPTVAAVDRPPSLAPALAVVTRVTLALIAVIEGTSATASNSHTLTVCSV